MASGTWEFSGFTKLLGIKKKESATNRPWSAASEGTSPAWTRIRCEISPYLVKIQTWAMSKNFQNTKKSQHIPQPNVKDDIRHFIVLLHRPQGHPVNIVFRCFIASLCSVFLLKYLPLCFRNVLIIASNVNLFCVFVLLKDRIESFPVYETIERTYPLFLEVFSILFTNRH